MNNKDFYKIRENGILLNVKVIPRASKNEIKECINGALKLKIKSPPVEGKANREIVKYFSKILGVSKNSVEILKGETSSHKLIFISNITKEKFIDKIVSKIS